MISGEHVGVDRNRSRPGEEGGGEFCGVAGFDGGGQVVKHGARLLATSFDHRQDRLHEAAAARALCAAP